ncbi:MAG TPA: transglycosylase family protein [Solirubrobacteraceae bacterium]|jgi:septal ring factor EnvC (AmiA/AmiB activator)
MVRLCAVAALLCAAVAAESALAQSPGSLQGQIDRGRAREQTLGAAVARLGRLERATAHEIAILEPRLEAAETALGRARARLAATRTRLDATRRRVIFLRGRLVHDRAQLGTLLRNRYMDGEPDLVTVVLHADGFEQLLETLSFLRRVERSDTRVVDRVKTARAAAAREQRRLTGLEARQRAVAADVRRRRDALAEISAGLHARRAALSQARAARVAALERTRASRRRAERILARLEAQRAAAARSVGPGGPWAIPWPIVQCESGGQNLPPNGAGASGYYQILDSTWHGLGGSTPHAYQASKAEQDRLAARLWAGGAGASNWVCSALVQAA